MSRISVQVNTALKNDLKTDLKAGFISEKEMAEILKDFEDWSETADPGKTFWYGGNEYPFEGEI